MTTYNQIIQKGKIEGEQIGIQKGEQIGIQKGKIEVIINSFKQGLSVDIIANITDLDVKEVEKLLKEHGKK